MKIHLIGQLTSFDRQHQSALLQQYGDAHSSVIIFQLKRRSWHVHQSIPTKVQRTQAMQLVEMDIQRMEDAYTSIGKRNDLSKVPLADSYRSCMHCNVKFLCPSRRGLEHAKAEQRSLMCEWWEYLRRYYILWRRIIIPCGIPYDALTTSNLRLKRIGEWRNRLTLQDSNRG